MIYIRKKKKKKNFNNVGRNCPLCNGPLFDSPTYGIDKIFCEKTILLPERKMDRYHYIEDLTLKQITQYSMPYRIITTTYLDKENTSQISIFAEYSTGRTYFKTLFKSGAWPPLSEENMIKKIKTLMVFS
jgi:hypothetical protein